MRIYAECYAVQIEDLPELNAVDGVADIGFALATWFTDPQRKSIDLLQFT